MKTFLRFRCLVWALVLLPSGATLAAKRAPIELLSECLQQVADLVQPLPGATSRTFVATIHVESVQELPSFLSGKELSLALQAPDRIRLAAQHDKDSYMVGRQGQSLWVHVPSKKFGVIGKPGLPRFAADPDTKDTARLAPFKLPVPREQLFVLPLLTTINPLPAENIGGVSCEGIEIVPQPEMISAFRLPNARVKMWFADGEKLPARLVYSDAKKHEIHLRLSNVQSENAWSKERWDLTPGASDQIETTALSHLTRFMDVAWSSMNQKIPTLGPATGDRRVVATEGQGRLELIDGTRVLFVKGTPEEMGAQHGKLLRKEIDNVVDRILYGVGVGSSFSKGRWFFGEIESAQKRLAPFIDVTYLAEMDAIAAATGRAHQEIRLANFFPELFHCSGFALFGDATEGGRMYHGRVLDYLKGVGLEQNAVVMVMQPANRHAWVNISYAGFVGSVTAMNEKHISIGEMGGRGEGNWDGKPMAQLMREVMERSSTIDEAVEIMRQGPRTCEYYYVISDGNSKRAVGIAATPTKFELVWAGESHPQLPHAVKDAVLMSAGDRYTKLVEFVKAGYGKFDEVRARNLMCRPVAMNSNIHSVLFAPDTLDFWVANADSKNAASHTRYTHYNLARLLGK